MKATLILIILACITLPCRAQSSPEPRPEYELGVELLRLEADFAWIPPSRVPLVQPMSGMYLRYATGRWGLRLGLGYDRSHGDDDGRDCNDCGATHVDGWRGSVRAGAQYNLIPTRHWLYAIGDMAYKTYQGTGTYINWAWGYQNDSFRERLGTAQLQLGLGAQARFCQQLYIGAESLLGFGWRWGRTDVHDNESGEDEVRRYSERTFLMPEVRLTAGVRFGGDRPPRER
jgi:hypothetical protein